MEDIEDWGIIAPRCDRNGYYPNGYNRMGFDRAGIDEYGGTVNGPLVSVARCERNVIDHPCYQLNVDTVAHRNADVCDILFAKALMKRLSLRRVTIIQQPKMRVSMLYENQRDSFLTVARPYSDVKFPFTQLPYHVQKNIVRHMDKVSRWCFSLIPNSDVEELINHTKIKDSSNFFDVFCENFEIKLK